MEIRARHWLIALAVAGTAHGSLLLMLPPQSRPKPASEPLQRIQLVLLKPNGGGSGSAAGGQEPDSPPAQAPVLAPLVPVGPALAPLKAPPETIEARPVEPPVSKPVPVPKTQAPLETKKPPLKARRPPPKRSTKEPRASIPPKPAVAAKSSRKRSNTAESASHSQGTGTKARSEGRSAAPGNQGSGRGGTAKGSGAASARSYYGTLASWLARHKRYPAQARRRQQQGTVRVTFTIDRQGRLLSHRIVSGSGHTSLDREVEAMLQRASPMPPIPAALGKNRVTITVPISFSLR
ncbi:energy transducer TonB [Imhoffiella purpurea]|uniref:Protein TonB n=1 Tax=Imhoffiella purpurea TaxID=1249627 RepID=W9VZ52_9GAMM|nr:energy transducer TonB [Imhoffiella purpurea]EXJ15675.1 Ferric siderophore transport system, periplasmic binding protein TonB [Imhoffiella purpurea]